MLSVHGWCEANPYSAPSAAELTAGTSPSLLRHRSEFSSTEAYELYRAERRRHQRAENEKGRAKRDRSDRSRPGRDAAKRFHYAVAASPTPTTPTTSPPSADTETVPPASAVPPPPGSLAASTTASAIADSGEATQIPTGCGLITERRAYDGLGSVIARMNKAAAAMADAQADKWPRALGVVKVHHHDGRGDNAHRLSSLRRCVAIAMSPDEPKITKRFSQAQRLKALRLADGNGLDLAVEDEMPLLESRCGVSIDVYDAHGVLQRHGAGEYGMRIAVAQQGDEAASLSFVRNATEWCMRQRALKRPNRRLRRDASGTVQYA